MTAGGKTNQILGEYLTDAGLLNIDDLREAANIARNQNLPIGKVLVMSGYLSKELLQTTIELQARVKDGQLEYKDALVALKLCAKQNISADEALSKVVQRNQVNDNNNNRLGEFLAGACLVSITDLEHAKIESNRCGLQLGRVLVNLSMISEHVLADVLNMQSLVRAGKMKKEEAIAILLAKKERRAENSDGTPGISRSSIPACSMRRTIHSMNATSVTPDNISPDITSSLSLHHLLRAAGLIETVSLEAAIKESIEDPNIMSAILIRAKLLEDFVIEAARECCQLIAQGLIKPEQAIIALHQCQRTRNSLHDCLLEFGWLQGSGSIRS